MEGVGFGGGEGKHAARMAGVEGAQYDVFAVYAHTEENFGAVGYSLLEDVLVERGEVFAYFCPRAEGAFDRALFFVGHLDHEADDVVNGAAPLSVEEVAEPVDVGREDVAVTLADEGHEELAVLVCA